MRRDQAERIAARLAEGWERLDVSLPTGDGVDPEVDFDRAIRALGHEPIQSTVPASPPLEQVGIAWATGGPS